MKMVKSLLLGSAAGLAAVAGAQAADLPVKAKAVEYVKICSLYGAGFYYIPGTDTCIKIGGFVRTEWLHNAAGSFNTNLQGANAQYNRETNTLNNRSRGLFSFDVRSQTEYGTLRSFVRAAWQFTSQTDTAGGSSSSVYLDRAFIQFAGFTFGKTQSFFDVPDIADMTYQTEAARQNTGGVGTPVFAYTAMLGNGVTWTLSAEDYSEKRNNIVDLSSAALRAAAFSPSTDNAADNHGQMMVDLVTNLRVDQAWGSAQVSGAAHENKAQYYGTNGVTVPGALSGQQGHPNEKWGWAAAAGILLKMPWNALDTFAVNAVYAKGATSYAIQTRDDFAARSNNANLINAGKIGLGWTDDAYFGPAGQLELPEVWSVSAGFQHYWTNSLRSSLWGAYANYKANSTTIDTLICPVAGTNRPGGNAAGCADYSFWQVGSRTIWNPVTNLDIGLEVMYSKVNTAFEGAIVTTGSSADPTLRAQDTNVWSGVLRIQRNFWP